MLPYFIWWADIHRKRNVGQVGTNATVDSKVFPEWKNYQNTPLKIDETKNDGNQFFIVIDM